MWGEKGKKKELYVKKSVFIISPGCNWGFTAWMLKEWRQHGNEKSVSVINNTILTVTSGQVCTVTPDVRFQPVFETEKHNGCYSCSVVDFIKQQVYLSALKCRARLGYSNI